MKPTERIIELSKKMNELGYEKEINWGGWYAKHGARGHSKDFKWYTYLCDSFSNDVDSFGDKDTDGAIPIPSLADGLEWLRKTVDSLTIAQDIMVVEIEVNTDNKIRVLGSTPHEAVLKAMIKVLESKE